MITSFGGIGLGLVWGFLMGKFDIQVARPRTVLVSLILASLLSAAEVYWLAGLMATIYFLLATLAGLFFHTQWRKELRARAVNL